MGPAGCGKSYQIIKVLQFLNETKINAYVLDLEDKLEAMFLGTGGIPPNTTLWNAIFWEDIKAAESQIGAVVKPNEWIIVDRIDLSWPSAQRWFTQKKWEESLADHMLAKSIKMGKKETMLTPRFDQGAWQVINEMYESFILNLLYKYKANLLFTTGIKPPDTDSPLDATWNVNVLPRGQKEIPHQPHSVFLLGMMKDTRNNRTWNITTAKDLPGREYFEKEELLDFSIQYLSTHYKP